MENQIRTILLLKVNSDINNNKNKIEFESLSNNNILNENIRIEFKEFFKGNIYEKKFVSNKLLQIESPISELDTNPISINSNKISNDKEIKKEIIFPLNYLQNLSNKFKSEKPLMRKYKKCKSA